MVAWAATNNQKNTNDHTALSNVLVAMDPTGASVNVYATADETFTTVDTKTTTTENVAGEEIDHVEYSFSTGPGPVINGYTNADAVTVPVTPRTEVAAYSAALDANPAVDPTPVTTDSTGSHFAPVPAGAVAPQFHDHSGLVAFADKYWNGSYNGFRDDCTDFASRAMHVGDGMLELLPSWPRLQYKDDHYWYQHAAFYGVVTSRSWAGAHDLATEQKIQGAIFAPYASWITPGDLIWANWTGAAFSGISHTGIVWLVYGGNVYIDQHSESRKRIPLFRLGSRLTWSTGNPHLHIWDAGPYENGW
jgi:hypothetical protein